MRKNKIPTRFNKKYFGKLKKSVILTPKKIKLAENQIKEEEVIKFSCIKNNKI